MLEFITDFLTINMLRDQDIVNRYAKDMTAQKYSKAVIMVKTVLSDTLIDLNGCIFSMRYWILRLKRDRVHRLVQWLSRGRDRADNRTFFLPLLLTQRAYKQGFQNVCDSRY